MFDDPFSDQMLRNTAAHMADFKHARLAAELAQENFCEALQHHTTDAPFIESLLVNCRILHYTATRFVWAKDIVERWNWTVAHNKETSAFYTYYDINYLAHGLITDMLNWSTEIKKEYAKNPGNKRLQAALINNKRKKAEIVEHIVKQLSDAKLPPAQPGDMNP
jgi:hypothetical protein